MPQNRIRDAARLPVVHQPAARPDAPERRRAHPIARRRRAVLHDAVAGADVVQQEIAERTKTPLGTVKTRVRLGMMKLRELIRPYLSEGRDVS